MQVHKKCECHKSEQLYGYLSDWADEKVTFTPTKSKIDRNRRLRFLHSSLQTSVAVW